VEEEEVPHRHIQTRPRARLTNVWKKSKNQNIGDKPPQLDVFTELDSIIKLMPTILRLK
jgi:hypothetical protein